MKKAKVSLQSLIEKIDWMMIEPSRASWKLGDDSVAVGFFHSVKHPEKIDRVKIRFGKNVLAKMKWVTGDKICIFNDPEHLLTFKLVKTENGKGYKLSKESGSFVHTIAFKWDIKELSLEARKSSEVNYHIYKNNLIIFKIGSGEEFEE